MKLKKLNPQHVAFLRYAFSLIFTYITSVAGQNIVPLQLVESVPLETSLGSSRTVRTGEAWLEMISGANNSIDMEIFYLSHQPGEALAPVLNELRAAADRGVQIRILTDDRMAATYPETLDILNQYLNITVRKTSFFNRQGGVMHAKYFLVDDDDMFLGSQNMDWRALSHIHELGIRLHHQPTIQNFKAIFELDWQLAQNPDTDPDSLNISLIPEDLRINREKPGVIPMTPGDTLLIYPTASYRSLTPEGIACDETEIIYLIQSARQQIEIQLLSYKPRSGGYYYEKLDSALREAAARGVEVRMILSNWNTRENEMPFLKSLQVIPNIEIRISSIAEYTGGFIPYARVEHCKYMVVDTEKVWLGTSNWSWSYFNNSRNLGMVISHSGLSQTVHEIFWKSWTSPYCQTVDICQSYIPPQISGEGN